MKHKFFIIQYFIFYIGYIIAEFLQKEMWVSQFIRHHLSDFFCGPVITIFTFAIGYHINRLNLVPVINCLLCIMWEININFDIIDLCCYIIGTSVFYLNLILFNKL